MRSILGIIFYLGINCRQGSFAVLCRSRRAQFIYYRNYNRIGLQLRGHSPSRLPVKNIRCLLHKGTKVGVFVWKGIRKNIISYYSSAFTINPQPRSARSHSVLFNIMWCFQDLSKAGNRYSETPPYGHLVITATFFGRLAKPPFIFLKQKPSLIRPIFFFDPLVTVLTGFNCIGRNSK